MTVTMMSLNMKLSLWILTKSVKKPMLNRKMRIKVRTAAVLCWMKQTMKEKIWTSGNCNVYLKTIKMIKNKSKLIPRY